jgi:hypothetical protein
MSTDRWPTVPRLTFMDAEQTLNNGYVVRRDPVTC